MFLYILKKLFGTKNARDISRLEKIVNNINVVEQNIKLLSNTQLKNKTLEFKNRLASSNETLDSLLPEAFAVVREAGQRILGMRPFDVQLIGGIVLHEGKIAEMRTGEGKTLVGTLPVYLNALSGSGVHVITVNEYLASRDAQWMSPLYEFLGLRIGLVKNSQSTEEKKIAYSSDITYGTNNEFGFDYLRDNMAFNINDKCQRGLNFALLDEVDSILIDEARTPLIISGNTEDSSILYIKINKLIPYLKLHVEDSEGHILKEGHYTIDEKNRNVEFNEQGHQFIEELLIKNGLLTDGNSLYSKHNISLLTHVYAALRAHTLFNRNIEYIVKDNQVLLIDINTGRTMPGRRLSEGLHQAIEAKEYLPIQQESQTLASTTFQNYFRLYKKLSGMTGTASTEAFELRQIYGLDVVIIPTHKPIKRNDFNDLIYLTKKEKYDAIISDIKICKSLGRPTLVGTASIESSEYLSQLLKKENIKHNVLNAKYHDKEADIIAQAGAPGAVTIATNMAGRGTDILLGGNWKREISSLEKNNSIEIEKIKSIWAQRHKSVLNAGGLHIIASERHESRRIDNQLRGRAGRQGDPGSSRFYLSLEDNLMRIFASDRIKEFMKSLGMQSGEAIEHNMVTNAIEKAQRRVENRNFEIRKQLLEFDDVANEQRTVIYHMRNHVLESPNIENTIITYSEEVLKNILDPYLKCSISEFNIKELQDKLYEIFYIIIPINEFLYKNEDQQKLFINIRNTLLTVYKEKSEKVGSKILRVFEKNILLSVIDDLWKEHLAIMDHLRYGIHLRSYAQKNPKHEYKSESFNLFKELLESIKCETIRILSSTDMNDNILKERHTKKMFTANTTNNLASVKIKNKIGRNDPCPCGSGKKYKHCHYE